MSTYHRINWDSFSSPAFLAVGNAVFTLKNETIFTISFPYVRSTSTTDEEHDAMHSSRLNSDISYPHSLVSTPVHEIPNDSESKIVARLSGSFAWDYTLRNLLPNNVNGVMVELRNSCNQSSLYSLVGYDAFYLGVNATKDSSYEYMEVVRDLNLGTHPNFTTTPGHCQYTIVRTMRVVFRSHVSAYNLTFTLGYSSSKNSIYIQAQHFTTATKQIPRRFMQLLWLLPLFWLQQYFTFTTC